jgi:taurine dioxygenase
MLKFQKLTGNIGVEIADIDLTQPLSADLVAAIKRAVFEHCVVFFRQQKVFTDEEHIRVGETFGQLDISEIQPNPIARREIMVLDQVSPKGEGADNFHRDRLFLEVPPMGSILQQVMQPESGGDTCWMSTYAAYDALSAPMQSLLDGLYARNSIEPMARRSKKVRDHVGNKISEWPSAIHPVVEVHPETGRKALNVNANWTQEIVDIPKAESDMLLAFLFEHVKSPDFQVRFRWNVGDVAFWDNRCAQHFAVADYTTRRIMRRVALTGTRPVGPRDTERRKAA